MKDISSGHFYGRLYNKKEHFPLTAQIELTYRCNLDCIHCYCKGSEDKNRELSAEDWKKVFNAIQKEGCMTLCLTGGEPLMRDDFLEIYSYAKAKGLIIILFTNGLEFTDKIIDYLVKSPPFSIEISLHGITKNVYESITQVEGSFYKIMQNIKIMAKKKLPLLLKTNCLKQNKYQIGRIKAFTEKLLGKSSNNKYRFRYDPLIHPRLNLDREPTNHRLSFRELIEVKKQDPDIWKEYQEGLHVDSSDLKRNRNFLYHCNAWQQQFFINPYGRLKFCDLSDKFSIDLKTNSFKEGFYKIFPQVLKEKFRTNSKCQNCHLRPICYYCPARAYLETGNEEGPVPYYCELAKKVAKEISVSGSTQHVVPQKEKNAKL